MSEWDIFYGPNAGYALELYERYQRDPASVDAETRAIFERMRPVPYGASNGAAATVAAPYPVVSPTAPATQEATHDVVKVVLAARMARSIREFGHLAAKIDPLGSAPPGDPMLDPATHGLTDADLEALPAAIVWPNAGPEAGSCRDALERLRAIYCGSIGYDFDHVHNYVERNWLHETVETGAHWEPLDTDEQRDLLDRLTEVEGFEHFLHPTFPGQKRFSIEGLDMLVPMLDELIRDAAETGTRTKSCSAWRIAAGSTCWRTSSASPTPRSWPSSTSRPTQELGPSEGSTGINYGWTGDVKYHLGARRALREGDPADDPAHAGAQPEPPGVRQPGRRGHGPRGAGHARRSPARPRRTSTPRWRSSSTATRRSPARASSPRRSTSRGCPATRPAARSTSSSTTRSASPPSRTTARSTLYASDLAKGFEIPIVHVNADDPIACLAAARLARRLPAALPQGLPDRPDRLPALGPQRGRRAGLHPAAASTQQIAAHPTVRERRAPTELVAARRTADDEAGGLREAEARLRRAADGSAEREDSDRPPSRADAASARRARRRDDGRAGRRRCATLNEALLALCPTAFTPQPEAASALLRAAARARWTSRRARIDWAHAETLAFAAILADGTPIRLTGQDTERGTFSQRHLVLHDAETGATLHRRCSTLPQARASFAVYNSPLSEAAVDRLRVRLQRPGAGRAGALGGAVRRLRQRRAGHHRPVHRRRRAPSGGSIPALVAAAAARLRGAGAGALQRAARALPAAGRRGQPARRQLHDRRAVLPPAAPRRPRSLADGPRPLVVMTPKSLLRHPLRRAPACASWPTGTFQPVLDDPRAAERRETVTRGSCSAAARSASTSIGAATRRQAARRRSAVARVEQLYPFPTRRARATLIATLPATLREIVWLQEEPRNMGAWSFVAPRLRELLGERRPLRYVGRPERASPAEGSADVHAAEQARIVDAAVPLASSVRARHSAA